MRSLLSLELFLGCPGLSELSKPPEVSKLVVWTSLRRQVIAVFLRRTLFFAAKLSASSRACVRYVLCCPPIKLVDALKAATTWDQENALLPRWTTKQRTPVDFQMACLPNSRHLWFAFIASHRSEPQSASKESSLVVSQRLVKDVGCVVGVGSSAQHGISVTRFYQTALC